MTHEETLNKLLKTIAEEQNYNNYELIVNEISSGGANYTSKLFSAILKENGKENLNMFAKVACGGEEFRKVSNNGQIYRTERYLYTELAKVFSGLEEEAGIPVEDRLHFTKYYGHDSTECNETIVLEDLTATGWESFDRFKSIDWPYASTAVTELAKWHALSFAYRQKYPEEYSRALIYLKYSFGDQILDFMMKSSLDKALKYVRPEYVEGLKRHIEEYKLNDPKYIAENNETTIIHGDCRPSNMMHKVNKDGTVDIKIVDLQTLQGNSPVVDLVTFIFTGSDSEFRGKYLDKLVDHYYTQLEAYMKRLNLEPEKLYSRTEFEQEWKEKLPFGLPVSVITLPIITIEPDKAPKADNMNIADLAVDNTSQLYQDRLEGVINDYVKWGYIK